MDLEIQGNNYIPLSGYAYSNYLDSHVLASYVLSDSSDNTGLDTLFENSLLLSRVPLDPIVDLKTWVSESVGKTLSYYNVPEIDKQKQMSFVCKSQLVPAELWEFTVEIDKKKPLYFAQYFYIHGVDAEILSFVSADEKDRSLFVSSLNTFRCK
ncbi:MAG: hypothetical protein GXP45_00610 [bacterium]|nr:hypothetical protein [bacterium]